MVAERGKQYNPDGSYKRRVFDVMPSRGPGDAAGGSGRARARASYGRRAVATAKWAAKQISVPRKGLKDRAAHARLRIFFL